jgi:hypothetical protein
VDVTYLPPGVVSISGSFPADLVGFELRVFNAAGIASSVVTVAPPRVSAVHRR